MALTTEVGSQDHVQGSLEAPVILVQYGDFECPYSAAAYPAVKEVQAQLGDQLCYVFRQFPLHDIHPHSLHAAEAAEAAAAQDRFWPMYELLFANQHALQNRDLLRYAEQVGLDIEQFKTEMSEHTHLEQVKQSIENGRNSGVHGTPTFFINGEFHGNREGLWDANALLEAIESTKR